MEQASHYGVERSKNPLSIAPVEAPKQPFLPVLRLTPRAPAAPLGGQLTCPRKTQPWKTGVLS